MITRLEDDVGVVDGGEIKIIFVCEDDDKLCAGFARQCRDGWHLLLRLRANHALACTLSPPRAATTTTTRMTTTTTTTAR